MLDLVYERALDYAEISYRSSNVATLRPRDGDRLSVEFLCEHLFGWHLLAPPRLVDGSCVIEFEMDADRKEQEERLMLDVGPFRMVWQGAVEDLPRRSPCTAPESDDGGDAPISHVETIILCKRGDTAIDEIHIVAIPSEEQWRSFLARSVDVIPYTSVVDQTWFDGMKTIRSIPLEPERPLALLFHTKKPPFSDVEVRRMVARALNLEAISRVACGDPRCRELGPLRIDPRTDTPAPRPGTALPPELVLRAFEHGIGMKAAELIQRQLYLNLGIAVHLEGSSIAGLHRAIRAGDFDLVLVPVPDLDAAVDSSLPKRLLQIARYDNAAFRRAVNAREHRAAIAFLQEDVPMIPLFQKLPFAVIGEGFCGGEPTNEQLWRWLGDLHPCGEESLR